MLLTFYQQLRIAFVLMIVFTLLTGLLYPFAVTGIAQLFFPTQANGSLIMRDNKAIGSLYIGQYFNSPNYFWGRPSATTPVPYSAESSNGSNLGPSNPALIDAVKERVAMLKQADPNAATNLIPIDLVTTSGSGLDAEISPLAAFYQAARVAKARGISEIQLQILIEAHTQKRLFNLIGEPRVNVLQLNLALDNLVIQRNVHGKQTP